MSKELATNSFYPQRQVEIKEYQNGEKVMDLPLYLQKLIKRINTNTTFKELIPLRTNEKWGIFARETKVEGARTFFCSTYRDLFEYFKCGFYRHLYEVIEYDQPCHLYYDVEYKYEEKTLPGDQLVDEIINTSLQCLKALFLIEDTNVVVLKSDSKVKFSRHIIISSKTKAFKNNFHVGKFVRENILIYEKFAEIVDPGVYSKNRCLRLIWSCKQARGKKDKLIPLDGTNCSPFTSSLEFFESTLVSNAKGLSLIGYADVDSTKPNGIPTPSINPLSEIDVNSYDLEDFCLRAFAPTGFIKRADYNDHFNTILMTVGGCRYCQRIGREHKSNSIYIVVKLSSGVAVQRCYDPECHNFESIPVTLPPKLLEGLRMKYDKSYRQRAQIATPSLDVVEVNPKLSQPQREKPEIEEIHYLSSSSTYYDSSDSIIEE